MRTGEPSVLGTNANRCPATSQAGFTLLGLLFLVAALGIGLAALGSVWSAQSQREKEAELLFIGNQYRAALAGYYRLGQGPDRGYPKHLVDLLRDPRFPNTVRHLRRLWRDPVTGGDWVPVRDEMGGIKGVHSASNAAPRKTGGFSRENAAFDGAIRYSDWIFAAAP